MINIMNEKNVMQKIQSMSLNELAEFLDKTAENFEWHEWFSKKYCENCPVQTFYDEDTKGEFQLFPCDLTDYCEHLKGEVTGSNVVRYWLLSNEE